MHLTHIHSLDEINVNITHKDKYQLERIYGKFTEKILFMEYIGVRVAEGVLFFSQEKRKKEKRMIFSVWPDI